MNPHTRRALSLFTLIIVPAVAAAPAEDPKKEDEEIPTAEYVEYRHLPELGQITISDGEVRGAKSVARVQAHSRELAKKGIFPCVDEDKPHVYRRTDELDGRKFETVVIINPPEDEDSDWTRHLTVRVDGRKKVDCSIGSSPDGEVFVSGVTIYPEEGTVEVAASDDDGETLLPVGELEELNNSGVITDDTLQPPPEDEEPAKPKTEKV